MVRINAGGSRTGHGSPGGECRVRRDDWWICTWVGWVSGRRVEALGAFTWSSFAITSLLFASEHGPYWEVGLLAGAIYNLWIVRTKSLGDCILAHAVTNGVLCAYVIAAGKWEYWL